MQFITTPESRLELSRAMSLMSQALEILDELHAPGEIGSMLDLAVARLQKVLDLDDQAPAAMEALMIELEREFIGATAASECNPNPWKIPSA